MKRLFFLLALWVVGWPGSPGVAEARDRDLMGVTAAADQFRLGEYLYLAMYTYSGPAAGGGQSKEQQEARALMERLVASEGTLEAFDRFAEAVRDLPWQKPWANWTEKERDGWGNMEARDQFFKIMTEDAARHFPQLYYEKLGYYSAMALVRVTQPLEGGASLADTLPSLIDVISGVDTVVNRGQNQYDFRPFHRQMPAEVRAAIDSIIALKPKTARDLPTEKRLAAADAAVVTKAVKFLRQAAAEGKMQYRP